MNILFDISHPAHFHLFKNVIARLKSCKHNIVITARDKDILIDLLNHYQLDYCLLTEPRHGFFGLGIELFIRDIKLIGICKKIKPDILLGTSVNITHAARIAGGKSIVFNEDDDAVVPIFANLAYPFAHKIINPDCIAFKSWGRKRIFHQSYHELAYLGPENFKPDITILDRYGLRAKAYVIARFSALKAHHDLGQFGISEGLWHKIENTLAPLRVIKSVESEQSHHIDPWDMHHIMAFSKMIISDSQTMTIEGAVLGIPAVRINTFIGKSTVLEELENRYGLAIGIFPSEEEKIIATIADILLDNNIGGLWKKKKERMIKEKINLTEWIINLIETMT